MGTLIEQNDTLQITNEQGFPRELKLETHLKRPCEVRDFKHKIFFFRNKNGIRNYHVPPCRNFLVENREGKWIYWGLIHVLEVTHDYRRKVTSGKFKLLYLYTPEEMRSAHKLIDRNHKTEFFNV